MYISHVKTVAKARLFTVFSQLTIFTGDCHPIQRVGIEIIWGVAHSYCYELLATLMQLYASYEAVGLAPCTSQRSLVQFSA